MKTLVETTDVSYYSVRCAGCRVTVGISPVPVALRNRVFCSVECLDFPAATDDYERNLQWLALHDSGWTPVMIGHLYKSAHSLVYRTIDKMRETRQS